MERLSVPALQARAPGSTRYGVARGVGTVATDLCRGVALDVLKLALDSLQRHGVCSEWNGIHVYS